MKQVVELLRQRLPVRSLGRLKGTLWLGKQGPRFGSGKMGPWRGHANAALGELLPIVSAGTGEGSYGQALEGSGPGRCPSLPGRFSTIAGSSSAGNRPHRHRRRSQRGSIIGAGAVEDAVGAIDTGPTRSPGKDASARQSTGGMTSDDHDCGQFRRPSPGRRATIPTPRSPQPCSIFRSRRRMVRRDGRLGADPRATSTVNLGGNDYRLTHTINSHATGHDRQTVVVDFTSTLSGAGAYNANRQPGTMLAVTPYRRL